VTDLRLRPVRTTDEDVVRAAHAAMAAEGFGFTLGCGDGWEAGSGDSARAAGQRDGYRTVTEPALE
jgi:hypothetical protein